MALIGYGAPAQVTTTISGTGASIDTAASALFDSEVGSVTRFTWASGTQTTASTVVLQLAFAAVQPVRTIALLGATLPAGLKVEIKGKRSGDAGYTYSLGGNSLTQRLGAFADGSIGAWWLFPSDNDDLVGVQFTIYNDVAGATSLTASQSFDIGEIAVFRGLDVSIKRTLKDDMVDPSRTRRTPNNQPNKLFRRPYRVLACDIAPTQSTTSLRSLRYTMATTTSCAFISTYLTDGAADYDKLQEQAMFGTMSQPLSIVAVPDGNYWEGAMAFEEYPAQ